MYLTIFRLTNLSKDCTVCNHGRQKIAIASVSVVDVVVVFLRWPTFIRGVDAPALRLL